MSGVPVVSKRRRSMVGTRWISRTLFLSAALALGCQASGTSGGGGSATPAPADFSGIWATDGTGAGGIRTLIQKGSQVTGNFDEGRGRYDGTVAGRKLNGRFWWNEDAAANVPFEETPPAQRGHLEVTLGMKGDAFTGRSKYDTGPWVSWNGLRAELPTDAQDAPLGDFTGTWATDGTGADGIRYFVQELNTLTGHFDEGRGQYGGVVKGFQLVGRFWWNEDAAANIPFEKTPESQRGYFEVTFSREGDAFTGRSKFENGEWESWNGLRIE
jgi:hypothetical protein